VLDQILASARTHRKRKVRRPRIVPEREWFVRSKVCYTDSLSFKDKLSFLWKLRGSPNGVSTDLKWHPSRVG
jgi:hypothetical protein